MNTDDAASLPVPQQQQSELIENLLAAEAHRLAAQWADAPPEVFRAALAAAKAERALRSQETVLRLRLSHDLEKERIQAEKAEGERLACAEREAAEREAAAQIEQLRHRRHVVNVTVGAVISIALLGAGVAVVGSAPWLSVILCGPSLLALAKVFVLHRSDPDDMKLLARASGSAVNAADPAPPPQQPPAP
ncbi:hypothetical protein J2Z21_003665 [Streptomyces griseochromogenes]|uniref:DUF2335 domain-containing protein n=1 Tax=Streptomyces griseochromogenes TaxID=68214 RepID=A0A1B1APA0_9ACTN|nr:hypothetical protein [Streptomyces griseochromogenes]ANP48340.1 hypothetical protein AVL59_01010 [Streptomyces griseochromogenes]MBP2050715.1 hypothetical protein [Streptomyces griseochromogenes]